MPKQKTTQKSHYEKLEEIPYEIPENWAWIRLGEVCRLENGKQYSESELPYLDVKYLRGKTEQNLVKNGNVVEKNEMVILVDGENSGEVFTVEERGYLGSTLRILKISEQINKEYLQIILDLYRKLFRDTKTGSAIPHLNKKLFSDLLVSLPPLKEQERIVVVVKLFFQQIDLIKQ